MSFSVYPMRAKTPEVIEADLYLTGADGANPTKNHGAGMTVTRSAEGVYLVTFKENNGNFLGLAYGFGATTAADVKGYTMTYGLYSTTALTITLNVWDSTFAAQDIIAAQYLSVAFKFRRTSVSG